MVCNGYIPTDTMLWFLLTKRTSRLTNTQLNMPATSEVETTPSTHSVRADTLLEPDTKLL